MFVPGDPARTGRIAFWLPDGATPPAVGSTGSLRVVRRAGTGIERAEVPAALVPVREALPVLTHARVAPDAHPSAAFWGAATLLALQFVARGLLLPGLSPGDHDAWRAGPLGPDDVERVRRLAAAMPPEAHAVPVDDGPEPRLPLPERLLRDFLDAVADTLPRSPAAPLVTGGTAYTSRPPRRLPHARPWAADVATGHDAGVRISLRVEVSGLDAPGQAPRLRAVPQVHSVTDPGVVADAAEVWATPEGGTSAFGARARMDVLSALRRAARAWPVLTPLLSAAVPGAVDLLDDDVEDLLGDGVRALSGTGVEVHWPRELSRTLTTCAVVGPADGRGRAPSVLSADAPVGVGWWFALGGQELSREELDRLAEANRPLVRLRGQWVLIDPQEVRLARSRQDRKLDPMEALGAVLTGSAEIDGRLVEVRSTAWLEGLRERLAPSGEQEPTAQPAALAATLRDYQRRGLDWLARMTSLGLGCCLADDMGLGKTVTLIALHLHRQADPASAGPTLVVCPTSLMGNWQREIERFAPGTLVRRFHGPRRDLESLGDGEFVLTTYGTLRLDAARLGEVPWGLLVADEAQHVKNPYAATARALRTVGARARVALTGTPVENN
ncbi:MAG TPA: SNF2-related protein, partial [Streptomyces sp.]